MTRESANFSPLARREALPEQIVRQLAALIKRGDLQPGDRLPAERTLAEKLGVGRPTLREALRALQLLGILDIRHGGGVFVATLQPDTLLGPLHSFLSLDRHDPGTILEARKVIEGALMAFVAKIIRDADIARLKDNMANFERVIGEGRDGGVDRSQINALAEEFRSIIEDSVDNPILTRAVTSLDILSAATRYRMTDGGSLHRLLENHQRMVQALAAHDPQAAQEALEAHIDYLSEVCEVRLRDQDA